VAGQTTASYKLREQLANVALPNDVVGKTQAVTGSIVFLADGTLDAANSKIIVDVTGLQTDQAMRDNYVRRSVLETSQYPNVTFLPNKVEGLPAPLPASGQVSFKLSGDLTIKNVTKPVTWDVSGTINGDQATGTATVTFKFADFNLNQPRVPVVLSIEDHITLQLDLVLQKTSK
jgi:polyisoprenoid-binding protein YceI